MDRFLSTDPEFTRAPAPPLARAPGNASAPAALLTDAGDFQSLPHRDGIDGAYAARLIRAR